MLYCYKLEDCSIHFMHWNVKSDDFFLRALLCLLPWVIFYVIYSAEHQCEHVMQCSVKNIYKGNKLHCCFCFNRTALFDLFAFWFLEKLIPSSVLHLEHLWVHVYVHCRSSCCRVVSRGWQRMVAVQAQGATATWAWRSPVATSEFHAKLCGNVCWFVKDLKFTSFLWPCYMPFPLVTTSQSWATARYIGLGWTVLSRPVICWARVAHLNYLQFGLSTVPLGFLTLFFFFASMQTRIIEIPFGSGFRVPVLLCCSLCAQPSQCTWGHVDVTANLL